MVCMFTFVLFSTLEVEFVKASIGVEIELIFGAHDKWEEAVAAETGIVICSFLCTIVVHSEWSPTKPMRITC